ncbi:NAD(P)/FAD-dependent oxidoreductase [Amycolatopsis sp. CA-230715]|uniref:NAD(P)/FAD-dependent oxidoreductase n=1 Tax=Amycolatopsis sp. CA-230715 TaxID=2745196 RepID=UPI001C02F785|nr:FAD-dependent oxidoreductase [Amycolatopsis sp. CA-230715]QWF84921.1 NADH dehydrogenase-like protein [Amycolatopsis sp. CA-230715]
MVRSNQVLVVGAGYAGVCAANRIAAAGIPGTRVRVINPRADFVERIRLHQLAAGTGSATRPLRELLHPDVDLVLSSAERIGDGIVALDDGAELGFDYLVYAVGSTVDPVPHGHVVGAVTGAERLRSALDVLGPGERVVVSGAGLTGIETATEIALARSDLAVELISDSVAASLPVRGRKTVSRLLARVGVSVRTGVTVTGTHAGGVELSDGTSRSTGCTVHTTGFTVPDLARRSGLPVDARGRLVTDARLICPADPRIVGVGDAAAPSGVGLRMSCQAAIPMGRDGAGAIVAMLTGKEPRAHRVRFVGQAISLGRGAGLIQPSWRDDTPVGPPITGRLAGLLKESVCRWTIRRIRSGHRSTTGRPRLSERNPA